MELDLAGLAAIIGVLVLIYKAIKTTPKETEQMEADVVGKYATAAAATAQHNISLQDRMTRLEMEINLLKIEMSELADGVKILTQQLIDANILPNWKPK